MFRSLHNYNFFNKRTLVRCDFNVPIANGKVVDDFRIQKALFTIKFLKKAGAKIIILSHVSGEKCSLAPVHQKLQELLREKIEFSPKALGRQAKRKIKKLKAGDVLLLENLRFYKEEEENCPGFAEKLALLGDVYVGEHFSVCHREHSSVVLLPKLLPHFAGFELLKEIEMLSRVFSHPPRPLVVIIGGAKLASKMKAAESLLKVADFLLFGGKIANTILTVKGISVGKPWPEEELVQVIRRFELTNPKIYVPVDVLASCDEEGKELVRVTAPGMVRNDEDIFDIGPETIYTFSEIIKEAGTVLWVGPLGFFERGQFQKGTKEVAKAIAAASAGLKIAGGGETAVAIRKLGLQDKFTFVSEGGGAMLAFLARQKMPGLEALKSWKELSSFQGRSLAPSSNYARHQKSQKSSQTDSKGN